MPGLAGSNSVVLDGNSTTTLYCANESSFDVSGRQLTLAAWIKTTNAGSQPILTKGISSSYGLEISEGRPSFKTTLMGSGGIMTPMYDEDFTYPDQTLGTGGIGSWTNFTVADVVEVNSNELVVNEYVNWDIIETLDVTTYPLQIVKFDVMFGPGASGQHYISMVAGPVGASFLIVAEPNNTGYSELGGGAGVVNDAAWGGLPLMDTWYTAEIELNYNTNTARAKLYPKGGSGSWSATNGISAGQYSKMWAYGDGPTTVDNFSISAESSTQSISGGLNLNDGMWHHVAGVKENSRQVLYIDGVEAADLTITDTNNLTVNDWKVGIGSDEETPDPIFEGGIDDARIYNYALNANEIAYLTVGVSIYYPLDSVANIYTTGETTNTKIVNFKDFAVFAKEWGNTKFWP